MFSVQYISFNLLLRSEFTSLPSKMIWWAVYNPPIISRTDLSVLCSITFFFFILHYKSPCFENVFYCAPQKTHILPFSSWPLYLSSLNESFWLKPIQSLLCALSFFCNLGNGPEILGSFSSGFFIAKSLSFRDMTAAQSGL